MQENPLARSGINRTFLPKLLLAAMGCFMSANLAAADARRVEFGALADGTPIEAVELTAAGGFSARIITLGATLQSLVVPDRDGKPGDIVLGHEQPADYLAKPQFFGVTVGRYANRIANGRFSLDGREYQLETNDGENHLHGGSRGLDKVVWQIEEITQGATASVTLSYLSPDGEGGYPGNLGVRATYTLADDGSLGIDYSASTDQPTIVNITNHAYFNLSARPGEQDILAHELTMLAGRYTPVRAGLIPTGELADVAGTPFDFRDPHAIGERIATAGDAQLELGLGYDHNWVLDGEPGDMRLAARLSDPSSGRVMELLTTAPGLQFYSGNFLDGSTKGKQGRVYRHRDALCLEPQVFPDSPNQPAFPSARLEPGARYRNSMLLRFPAAGG